MNEGSPAALAPDAYRREAERARLALGASPPGPAVYVSLSEAIAPYTPELVEAFVRGDRAEAGPGPDRGRPRLLGELAQHWVHDLCAGGFEAGRVVAANRRLELVERLFRRPGAALAALLRLVHLLEVRISGWERVPPEARAEWARALRLSGEFEAAVLADGLARQRYSLSDDPPRAPDRRGERTAAGDQHRERAQLRHAEDRLLYLSDQLEYPVLTIDESRALLWANPAAERFFGLAPGELPGAALRSLLADGDLPEEVYTRARALLDGRESGLPTTSEARVRRRGELVDVQITLTAWRPVGLPEADLLYALLLREVSAPASVDEALRRSEAGYRALIEGTPDGVAVLIDERIVFANPAFLAIAGRSREEVLAVPSFLEMVHPEEREATRSRYRWVLRRRAPPKARAMRLLRPGGEVRHGEVVALPLTYRGGSSLLVVLRDVTERIQLQARVMRADRLTTVGTLARGLSHELGTPFTVIQANLQFARAELAPLLTEDVSDALREADTTAQRIGVILWALRAFGGDEEQPPHPVDVSRVVEGAAAMVIGTLRRVALLEVHLTPAPPVLANEARLGQVFLALLLNAGQAMPTDGVSHRVAISMVLEPGRVVVDVEDDGVGIPAEHLPRIFDPFFTTKPVGVGTGLGLSAALGIVRGMGGDIEVASAPGRGTRVRVILPTVG